jgi:hypothetical protein
VNIGFGIFRRFVLNDVRQIGDINSTCGDVGCHQKTQRTPSDTRHNLFPHALGQIGTEFIGIITESFKHDRQIVDIFFCVAEDNGRRRIFYFDDPDKRSFLAHARHDIINVFYFGNVDLTAAQAQQFCMM